MEIALILRFLHVVGAAVLFGTGTGIAFFMVMARRSGKPQLIAHVAETVVIADVIFTLTAVILQPITGYFLALETGWSLTEGWVALSLALYVVVGLFWLPVVWIQIRLRDLARAASLAGAPLPPAWFSLYRIWFACGFPAFLSVTAIVWLMLSRPDIALF
mgnify:CR=1 FL=1|jgi:uncharacterized membrane protein